MPEDAAVQARRPLKTRQQRWAQALAARFARTGVTPNQISVASFFFAAAASACLVAAPRTAPVGQALLLVGAAVGIQLRLLCNLLDGLVAVEGGKRTPAGELYNDVPDRAADVALFAAAGYGIVSLSWGADLGWAASVVAVACAYVRYLGATMGAGQLFIGPMAKQHRMALLTAACLLAAAEALAGLPDRVIPVALGVVVAGGLVTIVRRLRAIARAVESR
jgi:phosphatidylglycerophosphate synthase